MLSALAGEELRRRLYAYIIGKHRDLYWRRLVEILLAAQRASADLFRLSREHERLHAEASAALRAQGAGLESAAVERANLKREVGALRAELSAWQERVAFMEGTRAWRLHQRIVDLKNALKRRPAPSDEG